MRLLKDLLLNHPIPGIRLSETRHICAKIASKILGVTIKPSQVDYHNQCVSYKIIPLLKTELLLHQEELIEKIKAENVLVSSVQ